MIFHRRSAQQQSHPVDGMSDESLLKRVAMQDTAAYEALYARYSAQAYGLILRIVKDRAIADEVLQEAYWQVWQRAGQFQGRGKAAAWLFQIMRHRSLDQLRRQRARPQKGATESDELEQFADSAERTPEATLWRSMRQEHVQHALGALPAEQRQCIELAYFEGLTQQRISDATGMSLGTVKSRLRLGMEKLEHLLRGQGYP